MSKSTLIFLERAMVFLAAAKKGRYPNAAWLAERCEVSRPTAHRVIQGLQDRFGAPLVYSAADRGFELTDPEWVFPFDLCGREEIQALLVATSLLRELGDNELAQAAHLLWQRVAERTGSTTERLLRAAEGFVVDRTDRLVPGESTVMILLDAIDRRRLVSFEYRSPWREEPGDRRRLVVPRQVRASDGALYLRATEAGEPKVFNLAFAADVTIGREATDEELAGEPEWSDHFGVWEGEGLREVTLRIGPPASRYFARQRWAEDQRDRWDGEELVRSFQAHLSGQLTRRLLSVGPWLLSVEPVELRDRVASVAGDLVQRLSD